MTDSADPIPTAADLKMRTGDLAKALAFAMVIAIVTAVTVASFVESPEPQPVARVTTEELQMMADFARAIATDPEAPRPRRRVANQMLDVVEAIENGEVQIVAETTAPAALPEPTTPPTTTTTTAAPPTTAPPRVHDWPGVHDAPPVTIAIPPVTIPLPLP